MNCKLITADKLTELETNVQDFLNSVTKRKTIVPGSRRLRRRCKINIISVTQFERTVTETGFEIIHKICVLIIYTIE